jgi:hypothetical protein
MTHGYWGLLVIAAVLCGCQYNQDKGETLYRFWEGGNVGYMDATGEVVIPARFHQGQDFQDGQAVVVVDAREWAGQWAVIDSQGNYLIEPSNNRPIWFDEGRWVMERGGVHRFGGSTVWPGDELVLADETGKALTNELNASYLLPPRHGRALFRTKMQDDQDEDDRRWGWLDMDGQIAIKPVYKDASQFTEGLAIVHVDGKSGVIDVQGEWVLDPIYDDLGKEFVDGHIFAQRGDRLGVIDRQGNWVRDIHPDATIGHNGDLAHLKTTPIKPDNDFQDPDYRFLLINMDGKQSAIDFEATGFFFEDGLMPVVKDGKIGYVNQELELVIPCRLGQPDEELEDWIDYWPFHVRFKERAAPAMENGKWGYIDTEGNWLVEPTFKQAYNFRSGLALVVDEETVGYINRKGEYIWRASLDETRSDDPDRQHHP